MRSDEIKKELEAAIALDPKLADAYSLLAYAQVFSGETEKGLATMMKALELSPRNETYQFNLANIYLADRKVDDAIALLRKLMSSGNPDVANHASAGLEQAESVKEQMKTPGTRLVIRRSEDADTTRKISDKPQVPSEGESQTTAASAAPVRFIKGKLTSIDCSAAPQALLTIAFGSRTLKMHIRDSKHVVLIGADEFSCDWQNKAVAVNYRERQNGEGDVVSLEVH